MNQVCRLDQLSYLDVDNCTKDMQDGVLGHRKYTLKKLRVTSVLTISAGHSQKIEGKPRSRASKCKKMLILEESR